LFADCYRRASALQAKTATLSFDRPRSCGRERKNGGQSDVPNPDANYRFYNDWGCGYSGEFVFNNPEFTHLKFKAVIEPCRRGAGNGGQPADGAIRLAYELEARRPSRLLARARRRDPRNTEATR
jgi:hypothetical protein